MKQKILVLVLVLSMILSATNVFADGLKSSIISVDDKAKIVRTVDVAGSTAYSVKDLAATIGAKAQWNQKDKTVTVTRGENNIVFKMDSNVVTVNGKEQETDSKPAASEGLIFVKVNVVLEALGCEVEENGDEIAVSTVKPLHGASSPKWLAGDRILASTASDAGVEYYVVNNTSRKHYKVIDAAANAVDVAVSNDGMNIAYVNAQGAVYVVDTFFGRATLISDDTATKSDLQWAPKDDKIYYLAGEKTNIIAEMNLADGKITNLNDDKIEYKSDLRVSNDGLKLLYAVTKTGTFKDVNGDISVDTTGTEPQLYSIDMAVGAKPMQLTTSKENKSSIYLLNGNKAIYVGYTESETSGLDLKLVSENGTLVRKVENLTATHVQVLKDGRVFALGTSSNNVLAIYEIDPMTARKTFVTKVEDSVVDFAVSMDGMQTIVISSTADGENISLLEIKMTKVTK